MAIGRFERGGDPQCADPVHRVAGVHTQIDDRHFKLAGVGAGWRQVIGDRENAGHLGTGRAGDQIIQPADQRADVDGHTLQRLTPGECEQPVHQGLGAFR